MVTKDSDLLLGCSYFDLSHCGYFESKVCHRDKRLAREEGGRP
jgi:hypothetical protein